MEAPKVILSEAERLLIRDANIILTKNSSIEKISNQFGLAASVYQQQCESLKVKYPELFNIHPKISKGEKHNGLPWIMLDYPRSFDKETGQFAIRTFFWWGNFFSIQLQVSKYYLPFFVKALPNWQVNKTEWMTGFTNDAWDMQLPNPLWRNIENSNIPDTNNETFVLKLAKKIPIELWESSEMNFSKDYGELVELMTIALSAQPVK